RGKLWTKIIREVNVAARAGGPDPDSNPRLRMAWDKAMAANMPKDTILRAVQRGVGGADDANYEEIRYEGYGAGGAAVLIDCMTDNRQRTVSEVRHALSKNGGNLGQDGCVAFMFKHCGQFIFAPGTSEEQVMEIAIDAGAEDIQTDEEGVIEVVCEPGNYAAVKLAFEESSLTPEVQGVIMKALNETELTGEDAERMQRLIDTLEGLDDVQEVYTTAILDESE
ncbi:MAG: YebC/PmpR family DNA-binding transcriptional regulator, partial [Alcaligenaceae bacterium]|nr:YebC/PmpR family DNA-binding transcriptional regulator [Alcaligenaceae bacterium]